MQERPAHPKLEVVPYPAEHKPKVHARIVATAARLFRKRGFEAVSIDELMHHARLTRGGFYAHFRNKQQLLREALGVAFDQSRENLFGKGNEALRGRAWRKRAVARYLTLAHRQHPDAGCAVPALATEIARGPAAARAVFESEVEAILSEMATRLGGRKARAQAIALLSKCVGALVLARAVKSESFAAEILDAVRVEERCAPQALPRSG